MSRTQVNCWLTLCSSRRAYRKVCSVLSVLHSIAWTLLAQLAFSICSQFMFLYCGGTRHPSCKSSVASKDDFGVTLAAVLPSSLEGNCKTWLNRFSFASSPHRELKLVCQQTRRFLTKQRGKSEKVLLIIIFAYRYNSIVCIPFLFTRPDTHIHTLFTHTHIPKSSLGSCTNRTAEICCNLLKSVLCMYISWGNAM